MSGRSLALSVLVVLMTLVLSVRLYEIQIGQGEIWAGEAARLVRSGTLLPYRRGSILDSEGRVLVRDEATYRLELSYREFRRNHVLGLVAHARSALESRAVPLTEALDALELWALELGELSPTDLERFARGAELRTATLRISEDWDPIETHRARRASDIRFYIARLFDLKESESRRLKRLMKDKRQLPSYTELVAEWRGKSVVDIRGELVESVVRSRRHLALLAERLGMSAGADSDSLSNDALLRIVLELESVRSTVEELVAAAMFREAAGFSPGRINAETLNDTIDLSWIARAQYWNDDRLTEWTRQTRRRWLVWRDGYAVPRLLVEYLARSGGERSVDRLLALLGTVHSSPETLEAVLDRSEIASNDLPFAVLNRLAELFALDPPDAGEGFVLPSLPELTSTAAGDSGTGWRALEALVDSIDVTDNLGQVDKQRAYRVGRLRRALSAPDELSRFDLELLAREIVPRWEARSQDALAERLHAAIEEKAHNDRLAPNGRLIFSADDTQLAVESLRDALRDYGDRSIAIDPQPPYEAVYLLTRFPEEYRGFRAVDARLRVRSGAGSIGGDELDRAGWGSLATEVIGSVSMVGVDAIQRQRSRENRMRELRSQTRTPEEDDELDQLVGEVLLPDELGGVSGIEGEWDEYLRGRNGYRERRGLVDTLGRGRTSFDLSQREDGLDVRLSLDAGLQYATEWMLEHPEFDQSDAKVDRSWFEQPVGAIVLLSAVGEVVVSASVPNGITPTGSFIGEERADRSLRMDRTLRKPGFLPPGSVFKPFVALWALAHLGLDPNVTVDCRRSGSQPAEYGGVRCWNAGGHGAMNLTDAIKHSCNCYFAWLGMNYPSVEDFRAMAAAHGFGSPTGLRRGIGGSGLFEEYVPELFQRRRLGGREASLAGNGLSVVEATPMQVARATLALATGKLYSLTNVTEVGGRAVSRPEPIELDISSAAFDLVRGALYRVANERGGTAYSALNADALGLEVVVKTGSADLTARAEPGTSTPGGAPKHTWVAGWLPPEDPVAVFVVFLDRARATSSHSAVYVASQFLRLPQMRAWLGARGVDLRQPTTEAWPR